MEAQARLARAVLRRADIRGLEFFRCPPFGFALAPSLLPGPRIVNGGVPKINPSEMRFALEQTVRVTMLKDSSHLTMPKFEINTRRLINGSLSFIALAAIIGLFLPYRSHAQ